MSEEWRPVPGFGGIYEVSDLGRVRSYRPWRGKAVPHEIPGSWHSGPGSYRFVRLRSVEGAVRKEYVHRLVAAAFLGPEPLGHEVRHLDGDPENSALSNLAYGTHAQNEMDKLRHGTHNQARKTHCPKGHPYDEANTAYFPSDPGRRKCRACRSERNALRNRRAAA